VCNGKSSRYTLKELKSEESFILQDKKSSTKIYDVNRAKKYLMFPKDKDKLTSELINKEIEELEFVREMLLKGMKNDKVKYILPESYKTKGFFTYNINNLNNLINLRTVSNTKVLWEFYELANLLKEIQKEIL
jgi:thymidylate synthase (FAD)